MGWSTGAKARVRENVIDGSKDLPSRFRAWWQRKMPINQPRTGIGWKVEPFPVRVRRSLSGEFKRKETGKRPVALWDRGQQRGWLDLAERSGLLLPGAQWPGGSAWRVVVRRLHSQRTVSLNGSGNSGAA